MESKCDIALEQYCMCTHICTHIPTHMNCDGVQNPNRMYGFFMLFIIIENLPGCHLSVVTYS